MENQPVAHSAGQAVPQDLQPPGDREERRAGLTGMIQPGSGALPSGPTAAPHDALPKSPHKVVSNVVTATKSDDVRSSCADLTVLYFQTLKELGEADKNAAVLQSKLDAIRSQLAAQSLQDWLFYVFIAIGGIIVGMATSATMESWVRIALIVSGIMVILGPFALKVIWYLRHSLPK